jgi:hypothetical protein
MNGSHPWLPNEASRVRGAVRPHRRQPGDPSDSRKSGGEQRTRAAMCVTVMRPVTKGHPGPITDTCLTGADETVRAMPVSSSPVARVGDESMSACSGR